MRFQSLILKCFVVICLKMHPVAMEDRIFLPDCNLDWVAEKFLLNGQIFQVRWYASTIILTACHNTTKIEGLTEFDLDRIKGNTDIQFYAMNLPPLPVLQAKKIYMIGTSVTGDWNCSELTELHIQKPNLRGMSPTWLVNCPKLSKLIMEEFHTKQVGPVIDTTKDLQELELVEVKSYKNLIEERMFPTERGKDQFIKKLTIKYKTAIDLRDNFDWRDISSALAWQISRLAGLEALVISSLTQFDFCAQGNTTSTTFPSLKYMELSQSNTSRVCLKRLRKMPRLAELKLKREPVHVFEFGELLSRPAQTLNVTFEYVKIETFIFNYRDYFALINETAKGHVTFFGEEISMDCSCDKVLWLSRAETEHMFRAEGVNCYYQTSTTDKNCDWTKCNKVNCDNTLCVCCEDKPGTFIADCRSTERVEWPQTLLSKTNITQLLVRNNRLTTLPGDLPDSLLRLDATNNDILRKWTRADLYALFSMQDRHMSLAGNPIVCNCENRELIITLIEHRDQIEDFDSLACIDSDVKITDVDISILCAEQDREKAKLTIVSLALMAAAATLVFGVGLYYRRNIQVFLFARGWCLFCVREEELDADRRYDVFLSFCHDDTEVVTEKILPVLDKEYSVCIHIRNFIPGEMIPTQINNCVAQSRRTVIVLSRSFLKSLWGILEFRTAHTSGLMEGRVRVVMVVLDDVLETPGLEGEVQSYVKLNTYVKFGDPWFWDKLRYSLPHRPTPHVATVAPVQTYDNLTYDSSGENAEVQILEAN